MRRGALVGGALAVVLAATSCSSGDLSADTDRSPSVTVLAGPRDGDALLAELVGAALGAPVVRSDDPIADLLAGRGQVSAGFTGELAAEAAPGVPFDPTAPASADAGPGADEPQQRAAAALALLLPAELSVGDAAAVEDPNAAGTNSYAVPVLRSGVLDPAARRRMDVVAGDLTDADFAELLTKQRAGQSSSELAAGWVSEHQTVG